MGNLSSLSLSSSVKTKTAFVQTVEHGSDMDMLEWSTVAEELTRRGWSVRRFTHEDVDWLMANGKTSFNEAADNEAAEVVHKLRKTWEGLSRQTPVVGGRPALLRVLRYLAVLDADQPLPERPDYPLCLRDRLGRQVDEVTFGEACDRIANSREPLFIKPRGAANVKAWTGFCVPPGLSCKGMSDADADAPPHSNSKSASAEKDDDGESAVAVAAITESMMKSWTWKCSGATKDTPVWISEVIDIRSEWRCYVAKGELLSCVCYDGDALEYTIDLDVVRKAAQTFFQSDEGSSAFALDFGVALSCDEDGRVSSSKESTNKTMKTKTVLIEINDGYSLGYYPPCTPQAYTDVLLERWEEIVHSDEA